MSKKPEVGMGATYHGHSDRHPFTIVEVKSEREVVVQADSWKVIEGSMQDGSAVYEFSPNPNGEKETITLRKDGRWWVKGAKNERFSIGERDKYEDPSF